MDCSVAESSAKHPAVAAPGCRRHEMRLAMTQRRACPLPVRERPSSQEKTSHDLTKRLRTKLGQEGSNQTQLGKYDAMYFDGS